MATKTIRQSLGENRFFAKVGKLVSKWAVPGRKISLHFPDSVNTILDKPHGSIAMLAHKTPYALTTPPTAGAAGVVMVNGKIIVLNTAYPTTPVLGAVHR